MAMNPELEKHEFHYSHAVSAGPGSESGSGNGAVALEEDDFGFTPEDKRRILRRIDCRLVLMAGVMYCVSLIDRANMGSASIAGMNVELKLINNEYNIANLVFFIPYIICQPLSTALVRRIGPRIHLSAITLLWGAAMIGMGFVKDFGQLAVLRVIMGLFEAGFFPSCVYLLSTWYTRYEMGKLYALFYVVGALVGSFAGVLAYGLMQMKGLAGLSGWRWIFIVEGALTGAIALVGLWLLVDFPDSTRKSWSFLSQRERDWVICRIQRDRGDSQVPPFNLAKFLGAGADWKIWAYAMIAFNTSTITYALAFTLPIILVENMGFSIGEAQCLVTPPCVFAAIVLATTSWLGDKLHLRGPIIAFNMLLCLVGLPIMGWASNAGVRYFGIFLVTAGATSNVPAVLAYQANNVRGQWKRAFCSASLVGFGGIGGIAGSLVFRQQDAATGYKPGMYACIACSVLSLILVVACDLSFLKDNRKADREGKVLEAHDESASSSFRYTY